MNLLYKPLIAAALICFSGIKKPENSTFHATQQKAPAKIQVAILLDVSGSMQGLIKQAKAQLWNMVITLGKTKCSDNTSPQVELALYEYGRNTNDKYRGYIRQLSPFTNDLDAVSKILSDLYVGGSEEYCGQVIYSSLEELKWDTTSQDYKVIFIAGNETFLKGNVHYTKACEKAKEKGVIVNTIYCGDYNKGIEDHWNLKDECDNGSYANIDHNAKEKDIATPYDTALITLNNRLNKTYIGYGATGNTNYKRQEEVDQNNFSMNKAVAAKRIDAKAQSNVYSNASWDLVDAYALDSTVLEKIDRKTLPDSLKKKPVARLKRIIKTKTKERQVIQEQIRAAIASREQYIAAEKKNTAGTKSNTSTLEKAIEKIIREQVQRFNMRIE